MFDKIRYRLVFNRKGKLNKDDTYLYVLFPKYNNATITYVGGNVFDTGALGGIIMPSADVSGLTEVVVS